MFSRIVESGFLISCASAPASRAISVYCASSFVRTGSAVGAIGGHSVIDSRQLPAQSSGAAERPRRIAANMSPTRPGSTACDRSAPAWRLLAQRGLAAELHAVLLVDGDHLHLHLVAHLADVADARRRSRRPAR